MRQTAIRCTVVLLAIALSTGSVAGTGGTVVVDRIDDGKAVLLVETDGETTDQRVVPVDELPADGQHEGAVLRVDGDGYVYDEAETERRSSDAGERFDRLTDRGGSGDSRFGTCRLGPFVRLWWC